MERAEILVFVRIGIDAVIEADRADGEFVAQAGADAVTHVTETGIVCVGEQVAGIDKNGALQFAIKWKGIFDVENGVGLAADRKTMAIMRAEFALAETAHSGAAAVEETLVNWNCGDVAGAFVKRPNHTGAGAELEQGFSKRDEVTGTGGRPKKLDLASDRAGGKLEGLIKDKTATRHDRAIAQIEGMKEANRTDEVVHVTKQIIIDIRANNFDMPL